MLFAEISGDETRGSQRMHEDADIEALIDAMLPVLGIEIAPDSYLPQRSGEPLLSKDISASDNVRLVWAYLTGLLELARRFETPHPGLVVFDEPGQQDISDASLQGLITRLSETSSYGQQAILATSKPYNKVSELLGTSPARRNDFAGHVLHTDGAR